MWCRAWRTDNKYLVWIWIWHCFWYPFILISIWYLFDIQTWMRTEFNSHLRSVEMPLQPTARTNISLPSRVPYYHPPTTITIRFRNQSTQTSQYTHLCREVSKIHYNMNHSKTTGYSHTVVGRTRRHTHARTTHTHTYTHFSCFMKRQTTQWVSTPEGPGSPWRRMEEIKRLKAALIGSSP